MSLPRCLLVISVLACAGTAFPQGLPDRVLVGYWHNWPFSPNNLTLTSIPPEYDVVNVAFATPTTPFGANMTFTPNSTLYPNAATFPSDIQALQAAGKKVQISIGGANDPIHVDTPADAQSFAGSMLQIINTYGFDGLDIDLEGSSLSLQAGDSDFANPTSPRIVNFISALNLLLNQLPPTFMLTAAPETAFVQGGYSAYAGIWGAYLPVLHALRHRLTFVHVQHYNTGSMFGRDGQLYNPATADFHAAMADMLIGGFPVLGAGMFPPLRADQVAIGLPASTQAAGSGYTASAAVHDALDLLYLGKSFGGGYALADPDGYPTFRGLMTWSVNWDVNAGGSFSTDHRGYLDRVFLASDAAAVSTTTGGAVTFTLRAGRGNSGRPYYLIPTASGTSPGTPLPGGLNLPVNLDPLVVFAYGPGGAPYFQGFAGILDGAGEAAALMVIPPLGGAIGGPAHFAYFLPSPFDFASPPVEVVFAP